MWGYHDIIGIILIVGGSAMVVAFAGSSQHDYCLSVLLVLFKKLETIIFLSILSALILGVFLFIIIVEKNLDMAKPDRDDAVIAALNDDIRLDNIQPSAETVDDITISMNADEIINSTGHNRRLTITAPNDAPDAASDSSSVRSMQFVYNLEPKKFNNPRIQEWYVSVQNAIQFVKEIKVIPRLKKKIKLADYRVRYLLPLSYASLGGLMATVTVLFAKATVNLLSISIFQGNNQYSHFDAWLITGITVVTACLQIYWINMGLARYDALLQIPVFYVVWTLFDVIGGGVYYGEFEGFTPLRFFLFGLGVAVIFGGVVVLSSRLKQLNDEEQNLVKAAVVAT